MFWQEGQIIHVDLLSDVGINYSQLEELLKKQQWQQADEETFRLMLKVAQREESGFLDYESIQNFPCTDLGTIDKLWLKYSNGYFGFSVQKLIWQECGGEINDQTQKRFGDRLGWYKDNSWLSCSQLPASQNVPPGYFPGVYWIFDWWCDRKGIVSSFPSKLTSCNIKQPTSTIDREDRDKNLIQPQQLNQNISDRVNQPILGMKLEAPDPTQTVLECLNSFSKEHSVDLLSDVGINYSQLEELLKKQQWQQADSETFRLMLKVTQREKPGFLDYESIKNFPCTDLGTIDQLWLKYSNGYFGFSVQKLIWQECGGEINDQTQKRFGDRLGWYKDNSWLANNQLSMTRNAPPGHFPGVYWIFDWWYDRKGIFSSLASKIIICNI